MTSRTATRTSSTASCTRPRSPCSRDRASVRLRTEMQIRRSPVGAGARAVSAGGSADAAGVVTQLGNQSTSLQRTQRTLFLGVDHDGLARLAPEDEADDAIVA